MRFGFFFHEAVRALTRNAVPSFAAMATVLVTVLVLGVFIPVVQATTGAANEVRSRVIADVYLQPRSTPAEVDRVRGIIENMSWFTGDDGVRYEIFGAGGGAELAAELDVPLLAQLPLVPALRAGLGLALQPEFLVWEDLRAGRVQPTLDDWQVPPIALHIVTPPGRAKPARVQALIEYLAAHFASAPWAGPGA